MKLFIPATFNEKSKIVAILAPLLLLAPIIANFSPKAMAPIFIVCSLALISALMITRRFAATVKTPFIALLLAFIIYGLASAIWSLAPDESISKAIKLALLLSLAFLANQSCRTLNREETEILGKLIKTGLLLGCALYISEVYLNHPVYNFFNPDNASMDDVLKKTKPAAILTFWLIIAIPFMSKREIIIGSAAVWFVVWNSDNRSVKLFYYLAICAMMLIYIFPPRLMIRLFFTGAILMTILFPVFALKSNDIYAWKDTDVLPTAVFSRFEIWEQMASRTIEKPVLGWGLDSSPHLPNRGEMSKLSDNYIWYEGQEIKIASLHPHNSQIQIWFELGAVGVGLICLFFLLMMRAALKLNNAREQRLLLLSVCFGFSYTLSLWGIWQSWFVATLCTLAFGTAIALRSIELSEEPKTGTRHNCIDGDINEDDR